MFVGEGLMKRNMHKVINEKNITTLLSKFSDSKILGKAANFLLKSGGAGKIAAVLKGISFVCVSMASYDLGEKIAKPHAEKVRTNLGLQDKEKKKKKIDQKV